MHSFLLALVLCPIAAQELHPLESPKPSTQAFESGRVMPRGVSSFGAARAGQWLYVYGGHTGEPHDYCREDVSGDFRRLNLIDATSWEELPGSGPVQGTSLVAHGSYLYRIGGMSARNSRGEPQQLDSSADVERFDTRTRRWEKLTPLPEPRSSHDACVLGDKLYVVGGWKLGRGAEQFHATALVADLSQPTLSWSELPAPPFRRRGLALAAWNQRLAAIGGMDDLGEMVADCTLFDPAGAKWSDGPSLPDSAFGAAACVAGERLFASAKDGTLYALAPNDASWQAVDRFVFPRLFHRQIALDDGRILALGGATQGGRGRTIELLDTRLREDVRVTQWDVPFPGSQKNREGSFVAKGSLYLMGGNNGLEQHDFSPERFVSEAWKLSLGSLDVSPVASFPLARQSMVMVATGKKGDDVWALGGFGHDSQVARTLGESFRYDRRADSWAAAASLPEPRTQFGAVEHGGKLWVFGGMDYDPRRKVDGDSFRYPLRVCALDLTKPEHGFAATDVELPRPRRAFGSALLDGRFYLIGGMREAFKPVVECDVFDFATSTWSTIPSPSRPRISPEVVELDGKLYLLAGSSPDADGEMREHTTLEVYEPGAGWSTVLTAIPGLRPHARAFASNHTLFLWCAHQAQAGCATLTAIQSPLARKPPASDVLERVKVIEASR